MAIQLDVAASRSCNLSHAAFDFIHPVLDVINRENYVASLNSLARERAIDLRFIPAPEQKLSAVEYETRIVSHRELIVNDNWHDVFNACIWLTFPQTKRIISELHVALGAGENNRRPRRRDVLTLFDESGAILLCEPSRCSEFEILNKTHQWKTMFVERRAEWLAHVRPILFGHGALEQLATNWHRGLTVKAQWAPLSPTSSMEEIDRYLATEIAADRVLCEDERRIPLPLLGVPGWFAENEDSVCYYDAGVFRPARVRV
ncbi:MAG: DUF3025 domain-containing protein [Casimicrobium sp.]